MERLSDPDDDFQLDDFKLNHGWEEDERVFEEREMSATQKRKVKRFSAAGDLQVLESAYGKRYEGNEVVWDAAMKVVSLPLPYQPAVREALSEQRWRSAANPIGYVKTAAMRIGLRAGINTPDWNGKHPDEICTFSQITPQREDARYLLPGDKKPTSGDHIDNLAFHNSEEDDPDNHYLDNKLSDMGELGLIDRNSAIDWSEVGKRAGLSREQAKVLLLKSQGLGRDAALAKARTEAGRRRLQTAWRELEPDRKGETIMANVREVLSGREIQKPKSHAARPSYVPPWRALQNARKRELTPVVHDTYEKFENKSYRSRWLRTI